MAKPHERKEQPTSQPRPGQQPHQPQKTAAPAKSGKEIRGIVRVSGRDLKGELPLRMALTRVKGVGIRLGGVLTGIALRELKLGKEAVVGELDDDEIERLEEIISHPTKYGVPAHMVNRQKDIETGRDIHLIGTDLAFSVKQDIEREKEMNTWKGFRHFYGQKVRGQHTRSTGRTGMTVGVLRKAVLAKAGAAAAAAQQQAQAAAGTAAPAGGGAAAAATAAAPSAPAAKKEKEEKK
ncbi:MAG: 30S ribosomal protein S13 [Candidatus Micrarchaeota archaeon]